jgi:putative spermidine/putrescine transport system permease protein
MRRSALFSWLQAAPLALVLAVFLVLPMAMIVVVSFFDYSAFSLIPDFIFTN